MRTEPIQHHVGRAIAAAFALAVWFAIAPPPANAGCSHYVRFEPLVLDGSQEFDLLTGTRSPRPGDSVPKQTPARPTQCRGAMCSGQPGVPSVPRSSDFSRAGTWAILPVHIQIPAPEPTSSLADDASNQPIVIVSAVFHPPRS